MSKAHIIENIRCFGMIKFAHIGDSHLGAWNNHPDMREYPLIAFQKAIDVCINTGLDFVIISGDLFDTSIPSIDVIRSCVFQLRKCKDKGLRVYAIPGSHDFSPTGRTIMSVLGDAGLIINIAQAEEKDGKLKLGFVEDKTGAKLTGMVGRKSCLEKSSYEMLDKSISRRKGFRIFVFHSAIEDYKPSNLKEMDAIPLSLFPKGFAYYAGGHVHKKFEKDEPGYGKIVFPGTLFPTSFDELEKNTPGFCIVRVDDDSKINMQWYELDIFGVESVRVDANKKSASNVQAEIMEKIENMKLRNKIVLLRVEGMLESGLPSDIDFNEIMAKVKRRGAKTLKKSTGRLTTREFEEVEIIPDMSVNDLEKKIIQEHASQMKLGGLTDEQAINMVFELMNVLKDEKLEGETNEVYNERIKTNAKKVLEL